ncbi:hypothetical protein EUGRSUZ_E01028, partial [Eucalyptus grandis]
PSLSLSLSLFLLSLLLLRSYGRRDIYIYRGESIACGKKLTKADDERRRRQRRQRPFTATTEHVLHTLRSLPPLLPPLLSFPQSAFPPIFSRQSIPRRPARGSKRNPQIEERGVLEWSSSMLETVKYLLGSAGPSGYGSKSTAEQVTDRRDLRSITAIITGATSGIGAETARVLAKRGARLVLPARNLKAAEDARARIASECPGSEIVVMALDLSSLASIRSFVAEFESLDLPLNLLINNAGKFAHNHAISEDGIEMTFATNYLGHFLLTKLLLNKMVETARATGVQGRIVNVSSTIHGWFSGDVIGHLGLITRDKR